MLQGKMGYQNRVIVYHWHPRQFHRSESNMRAEEKSEWRYRAPTSVNVLPPL